MNKVDIDGLRREFCYTPTTGVLIHRVRKCSRALAGQPAGSVRPDGYLSTYHNGSRLLNHRIIFALFHGYLPEVEIDHIDRDPANNRIENLRVAGKSENMRNVNKRRTNTSGIRGVALDRKRGKWLAYIQDGDRMRNLGRFANKDDAHIVRRIAEHCLWGGIHELSGED